MKRKSAQFIIQLAILAGIAGFSPALVIRAEEPPQPAAKEQTARPAEKGMAEFLAEVRTYLDSGDWNNLHALTPQLRSRLYRQGVDASDELAELYLRAARRAAASGADVQEASLIGDAKILSPDYPAPYFKEASRHLTALSLAKTMEETQKGFTAMKRGVRQGLQGLSCLAAGIGILFLTLFIIFSSLLAFRYLPLLAHDLGHRVNALAGRTALLVTFAVLLVPTTLGGGVLLFPLTAITIFWAYMNKRERLVSVVIVLLMMLSPLLTTYLARVNAAMTSPIVKAVVELRKGPLQSDTEAEVRKILERDRNNKEALLAMALHEKKQGRKDEALRIYGMIEAQGQTESKVFNNMANILADQGNTDGAIGYYHKAIAANSRDAMPHFNLSQVLRDRFAFDEAKKEFAVADSLDPELIRFYRDSVEGQSSFVMDEGLNPVAIWKMAMTDSAEGDRLRKGIGSALFVIWPPYGVILLGVLAAGLIAFLEKMRKETAQAFYCGQCGMVSCRHCTSGKLRGSFCAQCLQAFVRRDGVAARSRMQKILEITRYRQKKIELGRWISMVIPGAGHVALGYAVSGTLWMLLVAAVALLAAAASWWFRGGLVLWIILAVAVVLHVLSVYSCLMLRKAR